MTFFQGDGEPPVSETSTMTSGQLSENPPVSGTDTAVATQKGA